MGDDDEVRDDDRFTTSMTLNQIFEKLNSMKSNFTAKKYHAIFNNCRIFVRRFGKVLDSSFNPIDAITDTFIHTTNFVNKFKAHPKRWRNTCPTGIFRVYQLNTISHFKPHDAHTTSNICWVSPLMNLYDGIENGELVNFNDDVLRHLLRFILNEPTQQPNWNLRPYVEDLTNLDERYRKFIRNLYEVVKLDQQDSREHHRWAKVHHDIVFDNWPREWYGRTLERIERKKSMPTIKEYDLLMPVTR
ncbi:unnamed protein product [Adineta ricciae]|uniref:Uncharacterized protein n=1 Tax=Adineta ricciae TaxID=249248 RepID=A0A814P5F2_ADIRI|nr:unnamed protein product [Adineta ricciae]